MFTVLKKFLFVSFLLVSVHAYATQEIVVHMTSANYMQTLEEADKPLIIKIYAPWCGPCNRMKLLFHKFAELYKSEYQLAELNIEESPELGDLLKVSALPTIVVIQNKKIIGDFVGAVGTIPALKVKVEKIIANACDEEAGVQSH